MIGGLKKTASAFAIAAAAGLMSTSAFAADLGGNCCADLEERVAELEATTVRKGNRVVSLEVSGHVNEAILFWDVSDAGAEDGSGTYIGTNNESRSRFRFKGSAKINAEWSAGFLIEIGVRANGLQASRQDHSYNASTLDIRHEALYVDSKRLGRVWLGWTSSASDGITEICLGCGVSNTPDISTHNVAFISGVGGFSFGAWSGNAGGFTGEGDRREIVRYISPALAGFTFSAAWGQDEFWDIALRYANEFNGVRIAGGVAYQKDTGGRFTDQPGFISATECAGNTTSSYDCELIGASLSFMHVATGLYVAGAYGHAEDNAFGGENDSWYITGGIKRKWHPLGATNFYGEYGSADNGIGANTGGETGELTWYGIGVQQTIDAAAMDLYAYWKHFDAEGDVSGDAGQLDNFVMGAIIRF